MRADIIGIGRQFNDMFGKFSGLDGTEPDALNGFLIFDGLQQFEKVGFWCKVQSVTSKMDSG